MQGAEHTPRGNVRVSTVLEQQVHDPITSAERRCGKRGSSARGHVINPRAFSDQGFGHGAVVSFRSVYQRRKAVLIRSVNSASPFDHLKGIERVRMSYVLVQ
jgi:hypothetical protein